MRDDRANGSQGPSRRIRWLIAVVSVMAALTAGWPLISLAVSDNQPATAGRPLTIGPDSTHSAQFTPGRGWVIRSPDTDPHQVWTLRYGTVDVSVKHVQLVAASQAGQLWPGLADILRLDNPSARLGKPAVLTSPQGDKGLTGTVTENGRAGQAAIFPRPAGNFAIEIVSVAPVQDTPTARSATLRIVRSLRFPAASG